VGRAGATVPKEYNKIVTAVARELVGYIWDIAQGFDPQSKCVG